MVYLKYLFFTYLTIALTSIACAAQPDTAAQVDKAVLLRQSNNYHAAYKILRPLADTGDAYANYKLGELFSYNDARNTYFDRDKAQNAYYIAAKAGIPIAQSALASNLIHRTTFKVAHLDEIAMKTLKEACEWYEKAAMNGLPMGEFDVARCHESGWFTGKKDFVLAYAWYASAEILHGGESLYSIDTNQYNSNSMAAVFMQRVAERQKLSQAQIKQALEKAKEIALAIQANIQPKKAANQP